MAAPGSAADTQAHARAHTTLPLPQSGPTDLLLSLRRVPGPTPGRRGSLAQRAPAGQGSASLACSPLRPKPGFELRAPDSLWLAGRSQPCPPEAPGLSSAGSTTRSALSGRRVAGLRSRSTLALRSLPAAPPPGCEPGSPAQRPRRGPAAAGLSQPSPPPPAPALLSLLPARPPPPAVRPYPGRQAGAHSSAEPRPPRCSGPTRTHSPSAANQLRESRCLVLSLALAATGSEDGPAHTPTSTPFPRNTLGVCVEQASGMHARASDGLKASHGWVPTTLLLSISQSRREQTPASPDPDPSDPQRTKTGAEPVPAAKGRRIDDNGVTRSSPTRGLVKMSMLEEVTFLSLSILCSCFSTSLLSPDSKSWCGEEGS
ncbi:transcription initiation factor TFIID subunit 4-like [Apodemus sylvaticus]|uniref:transcription initiation factor TFIID subunit 4-like n=1 Tax=Apodemus sylvaticus TaxID=10129 RepID=UPI002243D76E|nr:transcription initiation factor TFIID subunit 4-like [Apodemus sylvaticus]